MPPRSSLNFVLTILALASAGAASRAAAQPYVYVGGASASQGGIAVIDSATNEVIGTVAPNAEALQFAVGHDGHLWFTGTFGSTVSRFDPVTNTIRATIATGAFSAGVAIGLDGDVFVASEFNDTVTHIDASTDTVSATIPVGLRPVGIAVGADGHLWVANSGDSSVMRIDPGSNSVIATVPTGSDPALIAVAPNGDVWVAIAGTTSVDRIDPVSETVVGSVALGSVSWGMVFGLDGDLWVTLPFAEMVARIDTTLEAVVGSVAMTSGLSGCDVGPDGHLWVPLGNPGRRVDRIDPDLEQVVASIPVGNEFNVSRPKASGRFVGATPTNPCRAGNVNAGAGVPIPLVYVDGSAGDFFERRVSVPADTDVSLAVAKAPTAGNRGYYAIWIELGEGSDCVDVPLRYLGQVHTLGQADRCFPTANTVTPGSCPCPALDFFGRGNVGATSAPLNAAKANALCLHTAPTFPRSPTTFTVRFPAGTYSVFGIHRDRASLLSPAAHISLGNTVVVDAE